jgi:DNA-binding transcriptional MerR regulator
MNESTTEMTIDELAQTTGIPTSTIRLYQSKGLLAAPRKEGRVGFYGPDHLERLRLIVQLQKDGFSLAGIGRLLQAARDGRALEDVLGLEARVAATWKTSEPLALTFAELAGRFPNGLPMELAQRALELGLVRVEGDHLVIDDPRFLDIGSELAAIGVPLSEVIDEFEALKSALAPVALRFTDLFRRFIWTTFVQRGYPPEELKILVTKLEQLNRLAGDIVTSTLASALKESAERFLTDESSVLRDEGLDEVLAPLVKAAGLTFPV